MRTLFAKAVTREVTTVARRPTRAQLADRARQDWLCERHEAEQEPCAYCARPAGQTCVDPRTGQPLSRQTAHLARLKALDRRACRRSA